MNQQQDPVVKDLNSWINRSAGQHQRRFSEGSASASRLHRVDTAQLGKRDCVSLGDCRQPIEYAGEETDGGMGMLAYMIVALILTCAAMGIGFIVGRYFS